MLGPCFDFQYFRPVVSIISLGKGELVALPFCVLNVMSLLSFFASISRCFGLV